jgi:hypothetical protein
VWAKLHGSYEFINNVRDTRHPSEVIDTFLASPIYSINPNSTTLDIIEMIQDGKDKDFPMMVTYKTGASNAIN